VNNFNGDVVRQEVTTYYITDTGIMTKHIRTTDYCSDGRLIESVTTIPLVNRRTLK